jgi:hypothetical protein
MKTQNQALFSFPRIRGRKNSAETFLKYFEMDLIIEIAVSNAS